MTSWAMSNCVHAFIAISMFANKMGIKTNERLLNTFDYCFVASQIWQENNSYLLFFNNVISYTCMIPISPVNDTGN